MEQMRTAHTILARTPERKGSLGKHKRKWENNIKNNHKKTERKDVD
jgi:hypothetical protein